MPEPRLIKVALSASSMDRRSLVAPGAIELQPRFSDLLRQKRMPLLKDESASSHLEVESPSIESDPGQPPAAMRATEQSDLPAQHAPGERDLPAAYTHAGTPLFGASSTVGSIPSTAASVHSVPLVETQLVTGGKVRKRHEAETEVVYDREKMRDSGGALPTQGPARLDPAALQLVGRVADALAEFCNDPAVNDRGAWQVQMEMRPDILPDTELTLSLSPQWLTLRFAIRDEGSRDLLWRSRNELSSRLENVLAERRDISISFD